MQSEGISKKTKNSLALLSKVKILKHFYLAGGTAVALHLGHRLSFDLDFFTSMDFSSEELKKELSQKGKFTLDQQKKDTLLGFFTGTKVSFFKYNYPLIGKKNSYKGIGRKIY